MVGSDRDGPGAIGRPQGTGQEEERCGWDPRDAGPAHPLGKGGKTI